jgi:hypothetical protein
MTAEEVIDEALEIGQTLKQLSLPECLLVLAIIKLQEIAENTAT